MVPDLRPRLTDVFRVQDDIAGSVVSELKITLLGAAPKTKETDPRLTCSSCRLASSAVSSPRQLSKQSIELYQQAVELDPTYAAAWVGLAFTHSSQVYGQRHPDEGYPLAREATKGAGARL